MTIIQAIILAIVEGLTEFLPVSSTGHMIIVSAIMGIEEDAFTKTFIVSIQLGAILSVVVLYWKRFLGKVDLRFYRRLFFAFLPALVAGALFKKYIDMLLENVIIVAVMLLAGGVVFLLLDKWFQEAEEDGIEELESDKQAVKIGMFQVLAMIPGVSRAAATIIGGLWQGLNKKAAAEFSFFLAVPTMFAATVKEMYDLSKAGGAIDDQQLELLLIGNIFAFLIAALAIKSFIGFLTSHGFKLFGYYRIAVGLTILILYWMDVELKMV
jgi:undecaprenyl-diphosphatase